MHTHWKTIREIFVFFPSFSILFSKWANNSPILRKKWENFGENTTFSPGFFPVHTYISMKYIIKRLQCEQEHSLVTFNGRKDMFWDFNAS